MKVLKFGGTSVGSIENMQRVKEIINDGERKIVVLSAMSGTTNALVEIAEFIRKENRKGAELSINVLQQKYETVIHELLEPSLTKQEVANYVNLRFEELRSFIDVAYSELLYNKIVSQGELISTFMFTKYLIQHGINARLLSALEFMRIDKLHEPDQFYIQQNLKRIIDDVLPAEIYITQGFICLDVNGNVANLQRGGSDYTATIIGGVIEADEVQIWTDIDGMHNNDPRVVENTKAISNLSFDEAAELAYFGAKILHPQTVMPARESSIPVRLKNTEDPLSYGTLIASNHEGEGIKAIAAKDGITAIKVKSARMLQAHGFLKKVFEIFDKHETPIDMITTSEVAVSLTIDDASNLNAIKEELDKFSSVAVDSDQSIICLVGHSVVLHKDTHKLFKVLQDIPVRMISYGGSNNNISLLVSTNNKIKALQCLNDYIF